jgi:hypothetical protein
MHLSIIQRVGVVPMSIAGIAKEVATISASALVFGDELTPLNITGVLVTVCGKSNAMELGQSSHTPCLSLFPYNALPCRRNRVIHAPQVS